MQRATGHLAPIGEHLNLTPSSSGPMAASTCKATTKGPFVGKVAIEFAKAQNGMS